MSLQDGTYAGVSQGFGGETKVTVTIKEGQIANVVVDETNDTAAVSQQAVKKIPEMIVAAKNYDVDIVSGASKSSQGIMDAVKNALEQAGDISQLAAKKVAPHSNTVEEEIADPAGQYAKFDQEISTELVIIGSGISGLSAAVQAGQDGVKSIVIEKLAATGGNGGGVEGQFAINSARQQGLGINITPNEIMTAEHQMGQYRANGAIWLDFINSSAANIAWCQENGVEYSGQVDNYYTGLFNTFHWFNGGHASQGYVPQMTAKAQSYGVDFIFNTAAKHLIYQDNKVTGLIAEDEDGQIIKINAQAVIVATGGIGGSRELVGQQGWNTEHMLLTGMPSSAGDGYRMTKEVGSKDMLHESAQLVMNYVQAFPTDAPLLYMDPINGIKGFTTGGEVIFVNEEGDRFVNENIYTFNMMLQSMAMKQNKASYAIFTRKMFLDFAQKVGVENGAKILDQSVQENAGQTLFESETIAGLADAFNLPKENLLQTIEHYNELCQQREDTDFNKDADVLTALEDGPFYIAQVAQNYLVGIGGIGTNKRFEVIDDKHEAIPGLYATGMDGVMLYKNVYTMNMPGTACGFSVHSGRNAVKNAEKTF
ncbi:fumarate reductase flavoprotein subunit [Ligilactobacillus salitolerans]|uniref:Urocanate reductase n=1 Tax=Ligilactobacillus salitolerans TaxID=1808352 RepID=A0A401IRA0_9LACO|nr:FAD-dependent oxidoreductase [Ligilactobacillus salitolerans]GBG94051.1 fumarate reductase flavoprotein subunit [Ligilactobacillus salitolerans]